MDEKLSQRTVPFFNYPFLFKSHEEDLLRIIKDVGHRGAYILQQDLQRFEQHLATHTGARYALGVANGTDAIWLALLAAGVGPGDEAIFCTHTYVATAAAIHFVGAKPVPVECGPDHMMDPAAVEKAVTNKTKAIVPTQVNGRTCNMDAIMRIAKQRNLIVLEDAAQGLGSQWKGQCAGTFGLAGTISFYPAKTLGSLGDGGAILTNDQAFYDRIYALRDHGRNRQGEMVSWGFNSRLDNLQAAILDWKLQTYDQDIRRRRELAGRYQHFLGGMRELRLPPAPGSERDHFDVFQNYEIEADHRDELQKWLKAKGIGTLVQWGGKLVHQFPALGLSASLPVAERMMSRALMLPLNTSLTDADVEYVCAMIKHFYAVECRSLQAA